MTLENPTTHCGFTIYADAFERPDGSWHGSFRVSQDGYEDRRAGNGNNQSSKAEAIQAALSLGRQVAAGNIPGESMQAKKIE